MMWAYLFKMVKLCFDLSNHLFLFATSFLSCFLKGSVYAPSFDHGVGDPLEDDIFIGVQ